MFTRGYPQTSHLIPSIPPTHTIHTIHTTHLPARRSSRSLEYPSPTRGGTWTPGGPQGQLSVPSLLRPQGWKNMAECCRISSSGIRYHQISSNVIRYNCAIFFCCLMIYNSWKPCCNMLQPSVATPMPTKMMDRGISKQFLSRPWHPGEISVKIDGTPWRIHGAGIYANMTGVCWW